jgi:hypothetical protein
MRYADSRISVAHPNVPDNERLNPGNSLAFGSMRTAVRCPSRDDYAPDENV